MSIRTGEKNWPDLINGLVAMPTIFCSGVMTIGQWKIALTVLFLAILILLLIGVKREFVHFPVLTRVLILGIPLSLFASWLTFYLQSRTGIKVILIFTLLVIHVVSNIKMKNVYRDRTNPK